MEETKYIIEEVFSTENPDKRNEELERIILSIIKKYEGEKLNNFE